MNISKEKEMYLEMLQTALQERRDLTAFILDCKKRIGELDQLEKMGMQKIETSGYIKLFNERHQDDKPEPKAVVSKATVRSGILTQPEGIQEEEKVEPVQEPKKKRVGGQGIPPHKMNSMIYYVMAQAGKPLHIKEIYKRVKEVYNIPSTFKNFVNNQLPKAMKANDQLIRTDRGVYYLQK